MHSHLDVVRAPADNYPAFSRDVTYQICVGVVLTGGAIWLSNVSASQRAVGPCQRMMSVANLRTLVCSNAKPELRMLDSYGEKQRKL